MLPRPPSNGMPQLSQPQVTAQKPLFIRGTKSQENSEEATQKARKHKITVCTYYVVRRYDYLLYDCRSHNA